MNKTKKNLVLFSKYLNNKNKSLNFSEIKINYYVGKTKYFPPVSKEWKNSIYVYNQNKAKNLPSYDISINELIKNYFNLYFKNKFLFSKHILNKHRFLSYNKIYISKAEIKHTNNKAVLTIYVYNREKFSLLKKIKLIKKSFYKKIFKFFLYKNNNSNFLNKKIIVSILHEEMILLRKYKLRLNLNKYKFEEKLLFKLKNLIFKLLNKKIEFNIINMKSILLHSDFFTKILTQKLIKRTVNPLRMMSVIINRVVLPKTNKIVERSAVRKSVDFNLLENKFQCYNLSSILKNNNLSELLNNLYYNYLNNNNDIQLYKIIFNSINYKNIGGIRLEVKGRLTRRNRADRSVFKVRWKGGLKNIDSSYKKLSSVNLRGYVKSNLDYSIYTSKRSIGAFAVKGWISGK